MKRFGNGHVRVEVVLFSLLCLNQRIYRNLISLDLRRVCKCVEMVVICSRVRVRVPG